MSEAATTGGRWLLAARIAWVAVASLSLTIVVFSVPALFEDATRLCMASAEKCLEGNRLAPEEARMFSEAGVSLRSYAFVMVGVDVFTRMVWF
ncbi:MAG: hypothetical protein ACRDSJ_09725, partial [Rubrobacteraceae bacterium]